jgi:hypothetical protein
VQVEYWYEQHNGAEAFKLIEQMRARGVVIAPYLDHNMVADIHKVRDSTLLKSIGHVRM